MIILQVQNRLKKVVYIIAENIVRTKVDETENSISEDMLFLKIILH